MKRIFALLLCICLLLAGCGNTSQAYTPTGDGLTWDEDYTGPATDKTEQEQEALVLTYYPEITMNPYQCTDFTNRALFSLIYQGLFCVDRSYNVQPMLCKSYRISEDMMTYTFYIEKATFSDGSYLTVDDVVASLNAAWESDYYGGRFTFVESIGLSADGAVQIELYIPYENLPLLLDIPIIKATQLDATHPLGTGPYVLQSSSVDGALRIRNNWWCSCELPISTTSIRLVAAESETQIRDNFEFYDVNLVCADPGTDHYADYRCDYELWDCENGMFIYLACSADSNIFSTTQMRSALTYAIDRDSLVEDYYRGFARSATLPASPLSPYYHQALASKYEYDPQKFTDAVAEAGLTEASVTLLVNSDDSLRLRVARAIGKMLEEGGLVVKMKELSGSDYFYAIQSRAFDLYLGQTKLSANMDLSPFFNTYGELSFGGVNNMEAYTLCKKAIENHGNYYTLHKTVMDNGLLCPVISGSYAVYATRGLLSSLSPARDNIFYYSLGKTMEQALTK